MSQSLHPHRAGLAVGGLLGFGHLIWSLLVAFDLAQPFLDLVFRLHMIQPPYTVMPFSLTMAVGLILLTSVVGYGIGSVLALIWRSIF